MCRYDPTFSWTCSVCELEAQIKVHYPLERWTDFESSERFWPANPAELPLVARCSRCSFLQRTKLDDFCRAPESDLPEGLLPTEADYLQAIELGLYEGRDDKLHLRMRAWQAGNDPSREEGARAQIRSAEAQANLEALYGLLCDDPGEAVTKAEVARELGAFDECLRLLGGLSRLAQVHEPAATIARLAKASQDKVAVSPWGEVLNRFSCPHCQRPGSLSWDATGGGDWLGGYDVQHAIRCGACRGVFWRGDHLRETRTWVEACSQGIVAEAGCCLALPLAIVAGLFSPKLAALCFAIYVVLVVGEGLASVVCKWTSPTSLPLEAKHLEELLTAKEWVGVDEERWLRVSLLEAAEPSDAPRVPLLPLTQVPNARALLELLGEEPTDRLLAAKIHQRLGDSATARAIALGVKERGGHFKRMGVAFLNQLDGPPRPRRSVRF